MITGANSGIGRATAVRAAEEGAAAVIVAAPSLTAREGGAPTTELVEQAGATARFVPTDVRDPAAFDAVVAAADEFGGMDTLANVAGISDRVDLLEIDLERLRRVMSVNFEGTFLGSQAAARSMIRTGKHGSIINVSSVGGMRGFAHASTYSASKGAVRAFTYALADAVAPHGIRANVVHPGQVDTEMLRVEMGGGSPIRIPLGRKGRPHEIADTIVWLASDLSSYVNGASIVVDGGYSAVI
ncbi:SDR family NAD(P)-dependent oxidoreductase [Nakamurella leprariae]|uniref:SDR family oxidoreductase n=1 Tax=Nakamurella leprariae TaxID=2803911 RepID=A0A938YHV5_9ACTN|nr:SDR family oxidoreductase [Nakamurella leprariae]MBM9468123.1 SDR family oxidoreductase [Nakamurella leprariae]